MQIHGFIRALVLFGTVLSTLPVLAVAPVEAVGLFKDRAMLKVAGVTYLLRVGETAKDGTQLLEANADYALVRHSDKDYRLTLSDRVGGSFVPVSKANVSILPDEYDQFRVQGRINRQTVNFLVDTGASVVAMSSDDASALGVDYQSSSQKGVVLTASGSADSYFVNLETLEV